MNRAPLTYRVRPGDRLRFDNKSTSWLARATAADNRYVICTASFFGTVHYTIIDWTENVRGPINVIGGGLGIDTRSGPDPEIDEAVAMLEGRKPWTSWAPWLNRFVPDAFEVSHRYRVTLNITTYRPATRWCSGCCKCDPRVDERAGPWCDGKGVLP